MVDTQQIDMEGLLAEAWQAGQASWPIENARLYPDQFPLLATWSERQLWRRQYRLVIQGYTRVHYYPKRTRDKAQQALADHVTHQEKLATMKHPTAGADAWIEKQDFTPWQRIHLEGGEDENSTA